MQLKILPDSVVYVYIDQMPLFEQIALDTIYMFYAVLVIMEKLKKKCMSNT